MATADRKRLSDEAFREQLVSLREPRVKSSGPVPATDVDDWMSRLGSPESRVETRQARLISASEVLEVLEDAKPITVELAASDARLKRTITWERASALEFLRILPYVDPTPFARLRELRVSLEKHVQEAAAYPADKLASIDTALTKELERIAAIGKKNRVLTMIDSTFATPVNQRPIEWGIDFVLHSATKYLSGQYDVMAGSVSGRADRIKALRDSRGVLGGVVDPQNAYLVERGIKTLGVRVRQQNASALKLAHFLESHPKIERVWYPGLASHPDHETAVRQMDGFGGVISFEVAGELERTGKFIDALRIPYIAPSLGGVESLIEQPALMSFYEKTTEERLELGIKDNLVRFAVGIEDTDDLLTDLEQGLAAI